MMFHAPQIIYCVLIAVGLGMELERHGKPKTGMHNAWHSAIDTAIVIALLVWGGFFRR